MKKIDHHLSCQTLSEANEIDNGESHDAITDCLNTIEIAKLVKKF